MRSAGLNLLHRAIDDAPSDGRRPAEVGRLFPLSRGSTRVLVLSVSAGAGHVRAAEALVAHAQAQFPRKLVRHIDLMSLVPRWFRVIYRDLYLRLSAELPEAWGWLYRKTDVPPSNDPLQRLRRHLQRRCARALFEILRHEPPDAIICTHFLPAELLAEQRRSGILGCPVWVQVTDFDLHHLWVQHGVDGYLVGSDELSFRLRTHGVAADRIVVSGIPLMPGFTRAEPRASAAAAIGLDPASPTVLMMGGGAGIGLREEVIRSLLLQNPSLQLIVLAGRNHALRQSLQPLSDAFPNRLRCFGFTPEVHRMMACADLAITKPGGLSTSECLAMGLPMLLVNPIPGQEERNAAYLMQQGVALRADDPVTLQFRLQKLLGNPAKLARMRDCALILARPHAAQAVLQAVA